VSLVESVPCRMFKTACHMTTIYIHPSVRDKRKLDNHPNLVLSKAAYDVGEVKDMWKEC
jgi:hypothetical protein